MEHGGEFADDAFNSKYSDYKARRAQGKLQYCPVCSSGIEINGRPAGEDGCNQGGRRKHGECTVKLPGS